MNINTHSVLSLCWLIALGQNSTDPLRTPLSCHMLFAFCESLLRVHFPMKLWLCPFLEDNSDLTKSKLFFFGSSVSSMCSNQVVK